MNQPPDLAEVLAAHTYYEEFGLCRCRLGKDYDYGFDSETWYHHAAQAWRDACTIRTVEQLNAPELPEGTLIAEIHHPDDGCDGMCWVVPVVWEMLSPPGWICHTYRPPEAHPRLPCRLIWHPEWAR